MLYIHVIIMMHTYLAYKHILTYYIHIFVVHILHLLHLWFNSHYYLIVWLLSGLFPFLCLVLCYFCLSQAYILVCSLVYFIISYSLSPPSRPPCSPSRRRCGSSPAIIIIIIIIIIITTTTTIIIVHLYHYCYYYYYYYYY